MLSLTAGAINNYTFTVMFVINPLGFQFNITTYTNSTDCADVKANLVLPNLQQLTFSGNCLVIFVWP